MCEVCAVLTLRMRKLTLQGFTDTKQQNPLFKFKSDAKGHGLYHDGGALSHVARRQRRREGWQLRPCMEGSLKTWNEGPAQQLSNNRLVDHQAQSPWRCSVHQTPSPSSNPNFPVKAAGTCSILSCMCVYTHVCISTRYTFRIYA